MKKNLALEKTQLVQSQLIYAHTARSLAPSRTHNHAHTHTPCIDIDAQARKHTRPPTKSQI